MMDMLLSKYEIALGAIELHLTLQNKSRALVRQINAKFKEDVDILDKNTKIFCAVLVP